MTILTYDCPKHVQNAIYRPRLRSGLVVNPDPYQMLATDVVWRGDIAPSPFGNHTKGELTEPHAAYYPVYHLAPADVYDDDGDEIDTPAGKPVSEQKTTDAGMTDSLRWFEREVA